MLNLKTLQILQTVSISIYSFYKHLVITVFCGLLLGNLSCKPNNQDIYQGEPVILDKEYSLIPGVCMYTWEGYGKKETFEDQCDKYSVGDKLGNNIQPTQQDTLKVNAK